MSKGGEVEKISGKEQRKISSTKGDYSQNFWVPRDVRKMGRSRGSRELCSYVRCSQTGLPGEGVISIRQSHDENSKIKEWYCSTACCCMEKKERGLPSIPDSEYFRLLEKVYSHKSREQEESELVRKADEFILSGKIHEKGAEELLENARLYRKKRQEEEEFTNEEADEFIRSGGMNEEGVTTAEELLERFEEYQKSN